MNPIRHFNVDGEPADRHELTCPIWTSNDGTCTCRDAHGHTRVVVADPVRLRAMYERAWSGMPLGERVAELDRIGQLGAA